MARTGQKRLRTGFLWGNLKEGGSLGKLYFIREDNIKVDVKRNWIENSGLDSSNSEQGHVASYSEHRYEVFCSAEILSASQGH